MRFVWAVLDWAAEGGFGRFVYRLLAGVFAVALIGEIAANGLTDSAYIMAVLVFGVLVALYSD